MIMLLGGNRDAATKFAVHKEFACYYSPVFKAAFNSKFMEGITQTYRLSDFDENVVHLLVEWIYLQDIHTSASGDNYSNVIELWVLGDRLCIPRLQNKSIEWLRKMDREAKNGTRYMTTNLENLYNKTRSGSLLRKFAVAQCAEHIKPDTIRAKHELFPKEFILDYASYIYTKLSVFRSVSWNVSTQDYYI